MKIRTPFCYGFCFIFFLIIQLQATPSLAKKLPVIASIYPIAEMIQQVGGDHVEVTYVLPAGASPHTFEPKPSLLKKFSAARIFFMVGAGLEFWAEKFVVLTGPGLMTVVLSEGVDLIDTAGHTHHNHELESDSGRLLVDSCRHRLGRRHTLYHLCGSTRGSDWV